MRNRAQFLALIAGALRDIIESLEEGEDAIFDEALLEFAQERIDTGGIPGEEE